MINVRLVIGLTICSFFFESAQAWAGGGSQVGGLPASSMNQLVKGLHQDVKLVSAHSTEKAGLSAFEKLSQTK